MVVLSFLAGVLAPVSGHHPSEKKVLCVSAFPQTKSFDRPPVTKGGTTAPCPKTHRLIRDSGKLSARECSLRRSGCSLVHFVQLSERKCLVWWRATSLGDRYVMSSRAVFYCTRFLVTSFSSPMAACARAAGGTTAAAAARRAHSAPLFRALR